MPRDPGKWFDDILAEGGDALEFLDGKSEEAYLADKALRAMVERKLFVVGEAVTQLKNSFPEIAEQLPAVQDIIGFRNLLAHSYFAIEHRRVHDIAINSLPGLLAAVKLIITDYPA